MSERVVEKSMLASAAGASLRHIASGCASTSSLVRPLRTDCGNCSASHPVTGVLVGFVEDEPLLLAAAVLVAPDQHETTVQLLAEQVDVELAVGDGLDRIVGVHRFVGAPVPDDHVAAAVLARGDDTLEVEVLDRVVLDVHTEPPDLRVERRPLRDRPAHEHAVHLEPEVVVQRAGTMPLDHEATVPGRFLGARRPAGSGVLAKSRLAVYSARRFGFAVVAWRAVDRLTGVAFFFAGVAFFLARVADFSAGLLACAVLVGRRLGRCRLRACRLGLLRHHGPWCTRNRLRSDRPAPRLPPEGRRAQSCRGAVVRPARRRSLMPLHAQDQVGHQGRLGSRLPSEPGAALRGDARAPRSDHLPRRVSECGGERVDRDLRDRRRLQGSPRQRGGQGAPRRGRRRLRHDHVSVLR